MTSCPHCGSGHIASRRALFRHLVDDTGIDRTFAWYGLSEQGACPPKSLFVTLLMLLLILAVPAAVYWFIDAYPALPWLGAVATLLLLSLLLDASLTYRRYRDWASSGLCACCRNSFPLAATEC